MRLSTVIRGSCRARDDGDACARVCVCRGSVFARSHRASAQRAASAAGARRGAARGRKGQQGVAIARGASWAPVARGERAAAQSGGRGAGAAWCGPVQAHLNATLLVRAKRPEDDLVKRVLLELRLEVVEVDGLAGPLHQRDDVGIGGGGAASAMDAAPHHHRVTAAEEGNVRGPAATAAVGPRRMAGVAGWRQRTGRQSVGCVIRVRLSAAGTPRLGIPRDALARRQGGMRGQALGSLSLG